jgi:hypothetical protein
MKIGETIGSAAVICGMFVCTVAELAGDLLHRAEKVIYQNRKKAMLVLLGLVAWHLAESGRLNGTDFLLIIYSWIQGRGHGRERNELTENLRVTHAAPPGPPMPPV